MMNGFLCCIFWRLQKIIPWTKKYDPMFCRINGKRYHNKDLLVWDQNKYHMRCSWLKVWVQNSNSSNKNRKNNEKGFKWGRCDLFRPLWCRSNDTCLERWEKYSHKLQEKGKNIRKLIPKIPTYTLLMFK